VRGDADRRREIVVLSVACGFASREKTAIVVSPLIALMQDQVAQLTQMGIPAAVLNSSQGWNQQRETERRAEAGEFRLLYLSPERLAKHEMLEWLEKVPVSFFAIDEAHCISEWGHEFRPDYRQLKLLRKEFPKQPIAAFTASATQPVRHDIIEQLQLKNPGKFIASFYRNNLNYQVVKCDKSSQQARLLEILRKHEGESAIVYSPTKDKVGRIVELLEEQGIRAIGYHAGMEAAERKENQERWMSDDADVLVGTIAFGLGINKAPVRAVIHLSLRNRSNSITRKLAERGATAYLRIVSCFGKFRTKFCCGISSGKWRIRKKSRGRKSGNMKSSALLNPKSVATK